MSDISWETVPSSRRRRAARLLIIALGAVLVVAWLGGRDGSDGIPVAGESAPPQATPSVAPSPAVTGAATPEPPPAGRWVTMARAPFQPRDASRGVWTGDRLLVFDHSDTGHMWSYDPQLDEWTEGPAAPYPVLGGHSLTWTGTVAVLAGGRGIDGKPSDQVAAYDPAQDGWAELPRMPIGPRSEHGAGWIEAWDSVVVWGGDTGGGTATRYAPDGAGLRARPDHDPLSWEWSPRLLDDVGLDGREEPAVLSGPGGLLVWGGHTGRTPKLDGALVTGPSEPGLVPVVPPPVAFPRSPAAAVVGSELVVWGRGHEGTTDLSGWRWSPGRAQGSADAWVALPRLLRQERDEPVMVVKDPGPPRDAGRVDGTEVVVWGGLTIDGGDRRTDGFVLDLTTGQWSQIARAPLSARLDAVVVWAGDRLLVWGGRSGGIALRDGAMIRVSEPR